MSLLTILEKVKSYDAVSLFTDGYRGTPDFIVPDPYLELLSYSNGMELFIPGTVLYGIDSEDFPSLREKNSQEFKSAYGIDTILFVIGEFNFGDFLCMERLPPYRLCLWDVTEKKRMDEWSNTEEFIISEIEDYEIYLKEKAL